MTDAIRDCVEIYSRGNELRRMPVATVMKPCPDGHQALTNGAADIFAPRMGHRVRMPRLQQSICENELMADTRAESHGCLPGAPRAK